MNEDAPLRTEHIDGTDFKIFLDDAGKFMSRAPGGEYGDWVKADSLKALTDKLRKMNRTKALRLEIPMTLLTTGSDYWRERNPPAAEAVTLTGVHARTHKALITRADGKKEAYDGHGHSILTRRLSDDECQEWITTVIAEQVAEAKREALADRFKLKEDMGTFIKSYVQGHAGAASGDVEGLEVCDE